MTDESAGSDGGRSDKSNRKVHRLWGPLSSPSNGTMALLIALVSVTILFVSPVAAQSGPPLGNIYCGTPVETGITLLFSGIAALGLPAGMFYTGRSGLEYMRSKGQPDKQNRARRDLMLSGVGLAVVVLAIVAPGIVSKIGNQMGFAFSSCVVPY